MSDEKVISPFKEVCRGNSQELQGDDVWSKESDKEKFNSYQINKYGRNSKKF